MLELDYIRQHDANLPVEFAVFVNLGWVPTENKDDIEMSSEPVPLLEPDTKELSQEGTWTGFTSNPEHKVERNIVSLTEITGLVRLGETESWFGKKNFKYDGVYNVIDLPRMATFFNIFNYDAASTAYIERIVPKLDDGEAVYPIPSTKDNFFKDESAQSYKTYATVFANAAILGTLFAARFSKGILKRKL